MVFIKIGKVLAHLIFWLSLVQLLLAFALAFGSDTMEANRALAQRYLSASMTGEAINEAQLYLVLGLALGILSEIGARIVQMAEKLSANNPMAD